MLLNKFLCPENRRAKFTGGTKPVRSFDVPLESRPIPASEVPFLHECYTHTTDDSSDGTMVWGTQVDMTKLRAFLKAWNSTASILLTPTTVLAHAVGLALQKHPAANSRILGASVYRFTEQNVVLPVQTKCGPRLILLRNVDKRSYSEISAELFEAFRSTISNSMEISFGERFARRMPAFLRGFGVRAQLWLANRIRLRVRPVTQHLVAAPVIINYFGFPCAPPLLNYKPSRFGSHALLLNVTLGPTHPQPVVHEDAVAIRPISRLFVRGDHRTMDAGQLAAFVRTLVEVLEDPEKFAAEDAANSTSVPHSAPDTDSQTSETTRCNEKRESA